MGVMGVLGIIRLIRVSQTSRTSQTGQTGPTCLNYCIAKGRKSPVREGVLTFVNIFNSLKLSELSGGVLQVFVIMIIFALQSLQFSRDGA